MVKLSIALAAMAIVAAPAVAEEVKRPAKPVKEICKWIKDSQWRTNKSRVCMTREKWARISRETQKEYEDYARSGSFGSY